MNIPFIERLVSKRSLMSGALMLPPPWCVHVGSFPGFGEAMFAALGLPPIADLRAGEAWNMLVEWEAIDSHMGALYKHLEGPCVPP